MNLKKLNIKLKEFDNSINATVKNGCLLLTGLVDNYQTKVKAGQFAVDKKHYLGLLNDIEVKGFKQEMIIPSFTDDSLDGLNVDCLVIGGGIVGCATLRELSKLNIKSLLVERGADLSLGQSGRNGGVVHVGLNFKVGSKKLEYCVRGNNMFDELCNNLHVPLEHKGQVTFAYKPIEKFLLRLAASQGKKKGIGKLKMMSRDELREIEPSVPDWSCGGLYMGTGGITSPYKLTIAMAENAVENKAMVSLSTAVISMDVSDGIIKSVKTNRGTIYPKIVINCAGLYSDTIADMAGDRTWTIHPRTGTDLITDKKSGYMARTSMGKTPFTLSPRQVDALPKKPFAKLKAMIKNMHSHSKGVGLIHSVDGNMLVGPNADEVMDKEDLTTRRDVVNNIINVQREIQPNFKASDVIAYFTGVRAPNYEEDFVVRKGIFTKNVLEAGGIQSPGITAAPAIAEDFRIWTKEYLESIGIKVIDNKSFNPKRNYKPVLKELSLEERNKLIKNNPDYGVIVCRCEEISKGEILDSIRGPIKVYSVDAIKKRVRPGMGRCQGSFCLPSIMKIISDETGIKLKDIVKLNEQSKLIFDDTK